jgi:presenilin-like A22 family membrane protease
MKHNAKITIILISMFIITQLIGLWVVNFYNSPNTTLPYGMEPPEDINPQTSIISILFAFALAVTLFFVLTRIKAEKFIRLWFFVVTVIAIGLTLNVVFFKFNLWFASFLALIIALPLAYFKIFKRRLLVHNLTELMIYPGIAAVFVPILRMLGIIILLLVISLYDIWAVWKSEFMQKMAKYQINTLKFFTGFFVPYAGKKQRQKIKLLKQKYKGKSDKVKEKAFKKLKIKINLAILGGGDIIFPIITAGIFYKMMGIFPALIITASATLGLLFLFVLARKGKYYPAMPFITIAMYLGMMINWLVF